MHSRPFKTVALKRFEEMQGHQFEKIRMSL